MKAKESSSTPGRFLKERQGLWGVRQRNLEEWSNMHRRQKGLEETEAPLRDGKGNGMRLKNWETTSGTPNGYDFRGVGAIKLGEVGGE